MHNGQNPFFLGRMTLYEITKRGSDVVAVLIALPVMLALVPLIAIAVKLTSAGPVLFWSKRVGAHGRLFRMPKFRSMRTDAPQLATHLVPDATALLTPIGSFLRSSSLDEIPQLWSVLKGDMTLVGPRPALFNQADLIALREEAGVAALRPGITGWAQVNGRDDLPIPQKVALDAVYRDRRSLGFDVRILLLTLWKVVRREGVSH